MPNTGSPMPEAASKHPLLSNLVVFGRLLRSAGVDIGTEHLALMARAAAACGLRDRPGFKDAARAILVHRRAHLPAFERAFELFFRPDSALQAAAGATPFELLSSLLPRSPEPATRTLALVPAPGDSEQDDEGDDEGTTEEAPDRRATASAREILAHRDFATLTDEEAESLKSVLAGQILDLAPRRTRRRVAAPGGSVPDLRRTLRRSLRTGGEPISLAWRKRKDKPRPLVLLCDISGSMELYSRTLLQLVYALGHSPGRGRPQPGIGAPGRRREAFVFATRLTRITRQLGHRNIDRALEQATAAVTDWGGGTRIGEALRTFNYDWGRRTLSAGAVVMIISDGWDRGDPELLEREVARLARSCQRLIWLNPLLGIPGYEPLTRGMAAALPHLDDFLPAHNLASLEQLAQHLATL